MVAYDKTIHESGNTAENVDLENSREHPYSHTVSIYIMRVRHNIGSGNNAELNFNPCTAQIKAN